jgi:hypothetical protein
LPITVPRSFYYSGFALAIFSPSSRLARSPHGIAARHSLGRSGCGAARRNRPAFTILAFNSIQILANPATIIYWIRRGRRESNRQKGPSDGFQIVVIF